MKNKFNFKSIILTLTLLTLGVGQMWATDYYLRGSMNSWNAQDAYKFSSAGSNTYTLTVNLNGTYDFKISDSDWTNNNTFGKNGSNTISLGTEYTCKQPGDGNLSLSFPSGNYTFTLNTSGCKLTINSSSFSVTYNANGGSGSTSSHTSVTPSSSVTLRACGFTKSNHVFAGWNTASDGTGTYYAPGASYTVTANRTFYAMWVPTAVLGGTKIMVYGGERVDWNQSTYYFMTTNSTSNAVASPTMSIEKSIDNVNHEFGVATLPAGTYYQGHWNSGLSCAVTAGHAYVVRGSGNVTYFTQKANSGSNYLYEVIKSGSTSPTYSVTTTLGSSSFAEGTSNLSVSTSGGPGKSVLGRTNKLLYFLYNGSTWSLVQLSAGNLNVSSLTEGSYSLASVLTDGYIYVRADKDDFNVYAVYSIAYKDQGDVAYTGSNLASLPTSYNHGTGIAALTAGEKTGYNFAGWYANSGCTGDAVTSISSSATGDKTFYAKWTAKTTTITLNNQGATTAGTVEVTATFGSAMPAITLPTKTGYTFGGYWGAPGGSGPKYYNADGSSAQNWNNTESTYTLFAKWTENMSTVSLVASPTGKGSFTIGGDAATSTTAGVATTRSVTAVAISGYHFVSWAITGGATISGTTDNPVTVTGDGTGTAATLTATFEVDAASYTITYGVGNSPYNNGTVSEGHSYASGSSQTAGTQISLTATPTNAHYKLAGWYSEAACSSAIAGAGTDNPYVFDLSANTSVYAKLVLKQCTITLNKNGGSTGASSVTASHGSTLPSFTAHSRTGYTLDGYYTDPSTGTKIIDASGALVASTTYANASKQWNNDATSLTLYAHWTAKQTTVTLNQQSGSGGTTGVTATYDAAMPDADMPTRTGYTFGGYYTNTGGAGTQYYTNTGASARNWDIEDATKTLYAKWTLITYTITYNNMTGATNHPSNPANYNVTTATITLGTPTKAGYDFGGWFTDNGTWNNQVTSIALGSTGNKVLYAKWTAKTYDITYVDANNVATIAANPSTGSTDATINFTVTLKDGYKNLSVTAVDAGSNTVTVTNPSSNNYRFTMPASAVTVTVSATALPIVYVLKTKHANSSLGDGATGFPSTGKIWAWKFSGSNNFYTSPGSFPGSTASSKATAITDDIIGDEWYRFIPDNTSYFDGSTAYHVIMTSTNQILNTEADFIENGSSHSASTHTGTIWIVPHGTGANTAYLYTSYPDEIATPYNVTYNAGDHGDLNVFGNTVTSGNSRTISTTRNRTLTASPSSGYKFNRWITSGSVTVADIYSASTTVSATGEGGTVTATWYEPVNSGWYLIGNIFGAWNTSNTTYELDREYPGQANTYYRQVTFNSTGNGFRLHNKTTQYNVNACNDFHVIKHSADSEHKYSLAECSSQCTYPPSAGTLWCVYDKTNAKFWIQDPVEFYSVNFGYGDGCDEFTAKDGDENDLVSGKTYVSGTALTFTQTTKDGYTFVGWNTAEDGSGSSLGTGSSFSVASLSGDVNVYAIYTENKTAITITTDGHGTITTPSPNNSPYSLGVATTQAINATASTGYHWNTWTVSGTAALVSSASTQSNTAKGDGTDGGTGTVTATFTPNTYRVHFHRNGGAGVTVYQNFTYDVAQNLTANSYTRTGYNFAGWALTTDGAVTYANGAEVSNLTTTNEGTFHLYAKWTPKQSALTFDYQISAEGYGTSGSIAAVSATYGAAMPTLSGNMPTAANGYAFIGFFSETGGNGTKYYNADKSSAHNWDVDTESGTTLYAYYKKAEITGITINHDMFEPVPTATGNKDKDSIYATPTIAPTPTGDTKICWVLTYENDNPVPGRSVFDASNGGTYPSRVRFSLIGLAAGTYKVSATLHTGTGDCGTGTTLSVYEKTFSIASDHTITVLYKDATGNTILASSTNTGKPLATTSITAPTITGYTFTKWKAGEGITIVGADASGEKASATISYYASFAGNLTAIYTKKKMIYFNNTLGWSDVYIYFYNSNEYWDATYGSGAMQTQAFNGDHKPYWEQEHGHMTNIEGTNIWYFDYTANSVDGSRQNVVFTESSQDGNQWFDNTKAVRLDNNFTMPLTMPMYVPLASPTVEKNVHNPYKTVYYTQGYWMNYPLNPGYTLKIYEGSTERYSVPFEYSADKTMPMPITVELNEATTYNFKIVRNDGSEFGNNGTMKLNSSGDVGQTAWEFKTGKSNCQLKTASAGDYTFTLNYGQDRESNYNYLVGVHYPVAIGSFRILYKDQATWSQGSAHTASWNHPSRTIYKQAGAKDTVSFFVSVGSTPTMKFQYASAINAETGAVTWTDVTSGTINLGSWSSVLTEAGVYNFITEQSNPASTISVINVEPYDGEYYIRVDAVSGKWENYRTGADHRMTYSSFSESDDNAFGEKYSHYKTKWCPRGVNVKFVIANDYSPCISDTLIRDVGDPFENIYEDDAWGRVDGELKAQSYDGSGNITSSETEDRYSANIRFMWNRKTNKISRAYVGSSTNKARKFLVLKADATIEGEDEEAISEQGITNGVILQDKQNWMYEEVLYITPGTKFKLFACYAESTPTEAKAQYFRGKYEATNNPIPFGAANSVVLIGGSGTKQKARIIYDFKTNRLMAAWIPSGAAVSGTMDINADVLVEREHHEAAQYITFQKDKEGNDGQLTNVKTVYGAMKFNRWILNNRQNSSDDDPEHGKTDEHLAEHHPPLAAGQQKSIYERSLYFISFPFDVKVSDIFGFGHYWDEWYLEYYDGLNRAKNGYWIDSPPNWKYVTPEMADTMVLRKYVGYILGLDLDYMQANNYNFWTNGISTIELFFPSTTNQETLKQTTVTIPALSDEYECKINRDNGEGDRRVKDSYWRCIGTPSFNIYNTAISDGTGTITWKTDYTWKADKSEFPFIYMWNKGDNTLTAQSTSTFTFLPMHSYLVQNGKQIVWTNVSAKGPSPIVARKTNDMPETEYEWRLALNQDTNLIDQTFVRMTNLEQVTDSFDFGQDLIKEFNKTRSNIYSYIGYEQVAANSMPLQTEQTTVIPVGVKIKTAGDYTFAMPDGTNGVGVTLIDTETGVRTSLGLMDYTVTLTAGSFNQRFFLEISPVSNVATDIELINDENGENGVTGVRKVLIDNKLFIIKDGEVYDARGAMVK